MTAIVKHHPLNNDIFNMIQVVAPVMKQSGLFGAKTEVQAQAVMIKGHELGFPFSTSFEMIDVIQDKCSLSPQGALALIHSSGLLESMDVKDNRDKSGVPVSCTVKMVRTSGTSYECTFTMTDAEAAGLIKNGGGWEKYPANMLRWRAIGYCSDIVFPDVIGGLYRSEEFGAEITPEGETIYTVEAQANKDPATLNGILATGHLDLDDILAMGYTAQQVLDANGGTIPQSQSDLHNVLNELEKDIAE